MQALSPSLRIAQITDPHIRQEGRLAYNRVDTTAGLRRSLESLLALPQRPDALVMTGDLVDFGRPVEYARLRSLIDTLPMPVYLLPGNHDDRAALRAAFPEHAWMANGVAVDGGATADSAAAAIQYRVRIGPLHLITLDTVEPGQPGGSLCSSRLRWLESELEQCRGEPVIVAMHHPPFATFIGHMDKIGLEQQHIDALAAIIVRHLNVERIICGHLHRAIDVRFAGTIASTSPAPSHQVTLDLEAQAASTFTLEPAAFRVLAWSPSTGIVSHLASAGRSEGPYPFHEADGQLID